MSTRRLATITVVAFAVGVSLDLLIGYSPVPGYGAAIGLFGCLGLILLSKKLLAPVVDRPEDHDPQEPPPDLQPDRGQGPAGVQTEPGGRIRG